MSSRCHRVVQRPCAGATGQCGCNSEKCKYNDCTRSRSDSTSTISSSSCGTSSSSSSSSSSSKKCSSSSSSSSTSSSSTRSCSTSSYCSRCDSSSSSSCCKERCAPVLGKCFNRLQKFDSFCKNGQYQTLEVKTLDVYDLDACVMSFNPRLIMVPSDDYPTLDAALRCVQSFKGGYVIKLCPGEYCLNENICGSVDNLEIIGDCSPNVGVGYIQGARQPFSVGGILACAITQDVGFPPFRITVNAREISVTGATNPNFSSMCPGRKVGILHVNGVVTDTTIVATRGNSIIVKDDPALNPDPFIGEGFFIYPDVTIKSEQAELRMVPLNTLVIQGCVLKLPFPFVAGTPGSFMDLRHNVIYNLGIYGYYDISEPNVHLGIITAGPGTQGRALFQSFLGVEARLVVDSNAGSSWYVSFFCATLNGCKVQNGGVVNLLGSGFYDNLLGLQVTTQSSCTIQGAVFVANKFAMNCFYQSNISSYMIDGNPAAGFRPIVEYNHVAFNAGYHGQIVVPNALVSNNTNAFLLDTDLIDSVYALAVGQYGKLGSLIIIFYNPLAPEYLSSIAGDPPPHTAADCQPKLAGSYQGINGVLGSSSAILISLLCPTPNGSSNGNGINSTSGVGTYTGVLGSSYGKAFSTPQQPLILTTTINPAIVLPSSSNPALMGTTTTSSSASQTSSLGLGSSGLSSNFMSGSSCPGGNCGGGSSSSSFNLSRNF